MTSDTQPRLAIYVGYDVIEHFPDDCPEPYGVYLHPTSSPPLGVGNIIELKLGERIAPYKVQIQRIRNGQLHVMDVKYIKEPVPTPAPAPPEAVAIGRAPTDEVPLP